jgi:hypothetical protein
VGDIDWVAYHSHGWIPEIKDELHAIRAIHAAAGFQDPVIVNTEMGHAAWRLDQEREMAATAVQKVLYCWAQGHRGALLYASREIGGPRQIGADYGYLDYTFCPRWMYGAVGALVHAYAGATFEHTLVESPGLHAYLFRRGDDCLLALFAPDNVPKAVSVDADAEGAILIGPMGNEEAVSLDQPVTAGLYPITIRLEGADPGAVSVSLPE